jgi:hypothetical protein
MYTQQLYGTSPAPGDDLPDMFGPAMDSLYKHCVDETVLIEQHGRDIAENLAKTCVGTAILNGRGVSQMDALQGRMIKTEVRGRVVAIPSRVSHESSTRGPSAPASSDATKVEANCHRARHVDEGGSTNLKKIEEFITAQTDDVRSFVEDSFSDFEYSLERQKTEQADLLIEILRHVYACEMVLEMLDNPHYRQGRREAALSKVRVRNRRFRAAMQGREHG